MIKVKVGYEDKYINYVKVSGHADYDTYGKDIVCASVSSIVITSVNLALKINKNIIKYKDDNGLIELSILEKQDDINKVFENMLDMLKELSKDYKDNIKII